MVESPTRVPRASIAVSILRDPEYLDLVGQPGGFAAFGIFVALVTLAREQNHGGDLSKLHMKVLAAMIGATQEQLENALNLLELTCAEAGNPNGLWLLRSGKSLKIRQYRKWNQSGWGGVRSGSGRQAKNQDVIKSTKSKPSCADSDSDSDSDSSSSSSKTHQSKTPPTPPARKRGFPQELETHEFRAAWKRWVQHRIEIRHKLTPTTITRQLASLAKLGSEDAVARIDQSIEQGWQGLFPRRKERDGQRKFRA